MQYSLMKSHIAKLISSRNLSLWLLSTSVTANGLLAVTLLVFVYTSFIYQRIYLVPPVMESPIWLSKNKVSPSYLSQMSAYFAQLRLNSTPASHDYQSEMLLRYTAPEYYDQLQHSLATQGKYLVEENISTVFYPVAIEVEPEALEVHITGDYHTLVDSEPFIKKRISYVIGYRQTQGQLWITQFQEEQQND